jgi:tetratricopeptide (TPR) repeat protein
MNGLRAVGSLPQRAMRKKLMSQSIALALALTSLIAGASVYAATRPIWRTDPEQSTETKLAIEDWPICATMAALGSDANWAELDADFAGGKKALAAEDWDGAIAAFELAALRDPRNADIHNSIGYAHRRLRQLGPAIGHFQQALVFNPRHRGAHEHLGELYLLLDEPARADEHLAALEQICLVPCAEFGNLKRAISAYRVSAARDAIAARSVADRE